MPNANVPPPAVQFDQSFGTLVGGGDGGTAKIDLIDLMDLMGRPLPPRSVRVWCCEGDLM